MFKRLVYGLCAVLLLATLHTAACSADPQTDYQHLPKDAEAILAKPDRLELFSLGPATTEPKPANDFHGWQVLGSTVVKDAKLQTALIAALKKGIIESDAVAGCFNPRHGLRATQGDKTVDLVICFECLWMEVHAGGKRSAVWTSGSPQPALDKVMSDAKVPLPKKAADE